MTNTDKESFLLSVHNKAKRLGYMMLQSNALFVVIGVIEYSPNANSFFTLDGEKVIADFDLVIKDLYDRGFKELL